MAGFGLDQIHILQSLPPSQWRSGHALRTAILLEHAGDASRVHLHDVDSASLLRGVLLNIAADAAASGRAPLIHFECQWVTAGP